MVRRLLSVILLVCVPAICTPVNEGPGPFPVVQKFEFWGSMSAIQKNAFYSGWTNGFFGASFMGPRGPQALELANCLKEISYNQAVGMIDKRYKDHPEKWSNFISIEMLEALTIGGGPCEGKKPLPDSK